MSTDPDLADLTRAVADLTTEVAVLRDWKQIHDVYHRYMWGFDRRDLDVAGSAFWPDAEINYAQGTYAGAHRFLVDHFAGHNSITSNSRHLITPQSIDIDGDTAHVDAYVTEFSTLRNGRSRIVGGRYVDRLDRRDGEWRIAVREFMPQFFTETDNNRDTNGMYDDYAGSPYGPGALDRTDVAYIRPLRPRHREE
jgi:hypothetical protein